MTINFLQALNVYNFENINTTKYTKELEKFLLTRNFNVCGTPNTWRLISDCNTKLLIVQINDFEFIKLEIVKKTHPGQTEDKEYVLHPLSCTVTVTVKGNKVHTKTKNVPCSVLVDAVSDFILEVLNNEHPTTV